MREEHGRHAGQFGVVSCGDTAGWLVEHQRPRNPLCTEGLWFLLGVTPTLTARAQTRRLQARGYERARGQRASLRDALDPAGISTRSLSFCGSRVLHHYLSNRSREIARAGAGAARDRST